MLIATDVGIALLLLGGAALGLVLFRVHLYCGGMAIIFPPMYDRKEK